jgi:hypothetical protein
MTPSLRRGGLQAAVPCDTMPCVSAIEFLYASGFG